MNSNPSCSTTMYTCRSDEEAPGWLSGGQNDETFSSQEEIHEDIAKLRTLIANCGGSLFSPGDPHFHEDFGDPGSAIYHDNGDPHPRFTGKMGTQVPRFRGSPFYFDTGRTYRRQ